MRVQIRCHLLIAFDTGHVEDAGENLLETLQVPVLVNASMDDLGGEHLLSFVSEQEHQIVQFAQLLVIVSDFGGMCWNNLFEQKIDSTSQILCKFLVLFCVREAELDLAGKNSDHRLDQCRGHCVLVSWLHF